MCVCVCMHASASISMHVCFVLCMLVHVYVWSARRVAPPPLPPQWSMVQDAPVGGVWDPSSPCGVVVGFWGLGFSLSL